MSTFKKKISRKQLNAEEMLYTGFGLAVMAKDQLDAFTSFLVKEGKLVAKDQGKFQKDLAKKGEGAYKKMKLEMEKTMSYVLKQMNMPTRKEFDALKRKVDGKFKSKK